MARTGAGRAVDQIAQGLGGLMSITGPPGGGPWRVGIPISDLCAGLYLAHGIMAALIERERSGEGQWVQTSLLEAMIAMLDFQATRWLIGGEVAPQAGNDHPTAFPMGVFPAKDGMVNIAAAGDRMFLDFLRVIGAEDLAQDERFRTRQARASHRPELRALVEEKTRTWACEALIEALNAVGVPCGPILTIDQVFAERAGPAPGPRANSRERALRNAQDHPLAGEAFAHFDVAAPGRARTGSRYGCGAERVRLHAGRDLGAEGEQRRRDRPASRVTMENGGSK